MNPPGLPACTKCRAPLPFTALNLGTFTPCPVCGTQLKVEIFPALFRPAARGSIGETVIVPGESACFYHENKKAETVCEACGRFLCGLCDCELNRKHYCPGCLESGRKKQTIGQLESVRDLYGRQALLLALAPTFITGLIALYIAIRYRHAPESLVAPRRWILPLALTLAILQTLFFSFLITAAIIS